MCRYSCCADDGRLAGKGASIVRSGWRLHVAAVTQLDGKPNCARREGDQRPSIKQPDSAATDGCDNSRTEARNVPVGSSKAERAARGREYDL